MSTPAIAVVLHEDEAVSGLGPIVALRPAFELRIGALNLRERLGLCTGLGDLFAEVREELFAPGLLPLPAAGTGSCIRVNARLCGPVEILERSLRELGPGDALVRDSVILASHGLIEREIAPHAELRLVRRPWELIHLNAGMLRADARTFAERGGVERRIHGIEFLEESPRRSILDRSSFVPANSPGPAGGAIWIGPEPVLVGEGVDVRPGAVIDASAGPVILGAGVIVHPLSVVTGPAYLGPGTVVNPGAKLRQATSTGAFCKVGGEIEDTLIQDLSNKQHDGFLGHAVVGGWVNLGADTNGSDLKNNYSPVRVDLGDGPVDSGESFVGPLIGDHAKTGIDTMLTTGAVVGVSSNVYGGGFVPRHVPSFSWGGSDGLSEYRLDEAIRTAQAVFARRDAIWTPEWERVFSTHFAATAVAREHYQVQ
jgi:UDP-N-acetylglucosamine diphosphorylase/glucosamine-1-phosphate N-acetyltransferase